MMPVILETSVATNAEVIVTGYLYLLVLREFNAIPILRPQEFLNNLFVNIHNFVSAL
ncbi:MAG: hypothetical protein RMY36_027035 [Nostoc sp. SerVER01]|uniref:hypothetical protein n=1 Tax=Nostoc sp. CCY 9925 TaxID=3103865 RepID=UPI002AD5EC2B|nr:hypothetical protein [Nostoc sp. SerVER01]MDZ8026075.1 hypothetical protein [Nostoc sp. DedQUE11]MDZ8076194.1 hypothetical protein [Nostoc sp. DedQUE01]MDZ8238670.1 hypothetical protein [Nostoc sp. ChiQUE01a]